MGNSLLTFLEETNKAFIHPRGDTASNLLLKELRLKQNERVLEIGVGTGSTLVKLKSRNPTIDLFGIDYEARMIAKARKRLAFSNLRDSVVLKVSNCSEQIPFETNYFDKIYVESVLGIQEKDKLRASIEEINRVLKPKGTLCINELIWSEETKQQEIEMLNRSVKEQFGIIQANEEHPYFEDWVNLLKLSQFNLLKSINVRLLKESRFVSLQTIPEFLSFCYSSLGRFNSIWNKKLRTRKKQISREYLNFKMGGKTKAFLFILENNKTL